MFETSCLTFWVFLQALSPLYPEFKWWLYWEILYSALMWIYTEGLGWTWTRELKQLFIGVDLKAQFFFSIILIPETMSSNLCRVLPAHGGLRQVGFYSDPDSQTTLHGLTIARGLVGPVCGPWLVSSSLITTEPTHQYCATRIIWITCWLLSLSISNWMHWKCADRHVQLCAKVLAPLVTKSTKRVTWPWDGQTLAHDCRLHFHMIEIYCINTLLV